MVEIPREGSASEHRERKGRKMEDIAAEMRAWPPRAMTMNGTPIEQTLTRLTRVCSTLAAANRLLEIDYVPKGEKKIEMMLLAALRGNCLLDVKRTVFAEAFGLCRGKAAYLECGW